MITGVVTANREAIIRLVVAGPNQRREEVEAVIDTGFNGFLTLPSQVIRILTLPFIGNRRVILADGRSVVLDLYLTTVLWNEREREVLVLQAEGDPRLNPLQWQTSSCLHAGIGHNFSLGASVGPDFVMRGASAIFTAAIFCSLLAKSSFRGTGMSFGGERSCSRTAFCTN